MLSIIGYWSGLVLSGIAIVVGFVAYMRAKDKKKNSGDFR